MLLVLTKKVTNRVGYIFRLLLEELQGIPVVFTRDTAEFENCSGPKLSYGVPVSGASLYFGASELLFETGISVKTITCIDFEGNKAIFPVSDKISAFPFDPFAAAFYLVSRYEEYLPHRRDDHGRFLASGSEAYRHGFLQKPVVNYCSNALGLLLKKHFPGIALSPAKYEFRPSIDIDAAYAYKHKGITRAVGGIARALQQRNLDETVERIQVLLGRKKDPFDTFDLIFHLQATYNLSPVFFVLLADYGPKDKNIPVNNRQFVKLIKLISDYAEIGIHPSYASATDPGKLGTEIGRLSRILCREITISRQHFLRLEFPLTYRNLINLDITDDYTLGYAEEPGFRASICSPFSFYDLDLDSATRLKIHPFAVMDGTLHDYLRLTPLQALEVITSLVREVKAVNGTFIPLWHNQSLNNQGEWSGWFEVFEKMIQLATGQPSQLHHSRTSSQEEFTGENGRSL